MEVTVRNGSTYRFDEASLKRSELLQSARDNAPPGGLPTAKTVLPFSRTAIEAWEADKPQDLDAEMLITVAKARCSAWAPLIEQAALVTAPCCSTTS